MVALARAFIVYDVKRGFDVRSALASIVLCRCDDRSSLLLFPHEPTLE